MPLSYLLPFTVTKDEVGLDNLTNDLQIKASQLVTTIVEDDEKVPSSKAVINYFAIKDHNHSGVYEPADSDIQSHLSSTENPHNVSKSQIGLGNVTNNEQLPATYLDTDSTLSANSDSKIASQKAVKSYIDDELFKSKYLKLWLYDYYMANIKTIATCNYLEGWVNNMWNNQTGEYFFDAANYLTGNGAAKILTDAVYNSGISLVKAMDLTKFNDGSSSSTSDYISYQLYLTQTAYNAIADNININFSNNDRPSLTNCFYYVVNKSVLSTGWNYIVVSKSSFFTLGSPTWSAVKGVSVYANSSMGNDREITVDNIQMIRKDPLANAPNPFQRYDGSSWIRDFYDANNKYFVGIEFGNLAARKYDSYKRECITLINDSGTIKAIVNIAGTLYKVDLSGV